MLLSGLGTEFPHPIPPGEVALEIIITVRMLISTATNTIFSFLSMKIRHW